MASYRVEIRVTVYEQGETKVTYHIQANSDTEAKAAAIARAASAYPNAQSYGFGNCFDGA